MSESVRTKNARNGEGAGKSGNANSIHQMALTLQFGTAVLEQNLKGDTFEKLCFIANIAMLVFALLEITESCLNVSIPPYDQAT